MIIVSSFHEEAKGQKKKVGVHHDLARLFTEASQVLAGAPSNALLAGLFQDAAPKKMKTNVWARLRGKQEQLTIQVTISPLPCYIDQLHTVISVDCFFARVKSWTDL